MKQWKNPKYETKIIITGMYPSRLPSQSIPTVTSIATSHQMLTNPRNVTSHQVRTRPRAIMTRRSCAEIWAFIIIIGYNTHRITPINSNNNHSLSNKVTTAWEVLMLSNRRWESMEVPALLVLAVRLPPKEMAIPRHLCLGRKPATQQLMTTLPPLRPDITRAVMEQLAAVKSRRRPAMDLPAKGAASRWEDHCHRVRYQRYPHKMEATLGKCRIFWILCKFEIFMLLRISAQKINKPKHEYKKDCDLLILVFMIVGPLQCLRKIWA